MEENYYNEMKCCLDRMATSGELEYHSLFVYGQSEASGQIASYLKKIGYTVVGILDSNINKQGKQYMGVTIFAPEYILRFQGDNTIVLIASKAFEEMKIKLLELGFQGRIIKLVDYNTFVEYSLTEATFKMKYERVKRGINTLIEIKSTYNNKLLVICPYNALGDVYYAMAYLPYFLHNKRIKEYIVVLVGNGCKKVAEMFIREMIVAINQREMDELVQAILYSGEKQALIVHHDRPYTNDMTPFIDIGKLTLQDMYCCGIYGLKHDTKANSPSFFREFSKKEQMKKGKSIIISPYAKSVVGIPGCIWNDLIKYYLKNGFDVYTNVVGEQKALKDTVPIIIPIEEMISAVEYAGYFIGIRSGLCDVITTAKCVKIVIFPDAYYSITNTKVAEFFKLEGWKSIVVRTN